MRKLSKFRLMIYVLASVGFILVSLFAYQFGFRHPIWTLRAFRITSSSMCPTVCEGDFVLTDMKRSSADFPRRGDVIMMTQSSSSSLFIKRVIGLPGDTIRSGPNGTLLVNGNPLPPRSVCGDSSGNTNDDTGPDSEFKEATVPPGQIFVIGDDLPHSFDSRLKEFGAVTSDQVRGIPWMIYMSGNPSRIGCDVR
jgi:signal peptidase I